MKTIAKLLEGYPDAKLLFVAEELFEGQAPAEGAAHSLVRDINRMIDAGQVRFNDNARHVYLPTVRTLVKRELARRYMLAIELGMVQADQVTKVAKTKNRALNIPGQLSLDLEEVKD